MDFMHKQSPPDGQHAPPSFELVLEAGRTEQNYWMDLWRYRELFHVLAWRDVSVRYKQTVLGVGWALIRPLLTVAIFTFVFGRIAKLSSEGTAPYALLVFAGMLPWTFFSNSIAESSNSLVANANLISKVYFPRLIVPTATMIVSMVDFLLNMFLLVGMMIWFSWMPTWKILFLPVFMALAVVASLGPSLWITALNVKYRDFRYIVPFIVQFGLYISPVGFSSTVVPAEWRMLYSLNPIVAVIDGFRWCIIGEAALYWPGVLIGATESLLLLWLSIRQFRKVEKSFADLI